VVIDDLPAGIACTGEKIAKGRDETTLSFTATADAPLTVAACRVRLVATRDGAEVGRAAECDARRGEPPLAHLHVCVALPTPFAVVGESEIPYARRGTHHVRRYRLVRSGFTGTVTVRLAEKQMRHLQGVEGPDVIVPPDAEEFEYPVFLPTRLELARTSRTVVTAIGEVADDDGNRHQVCFTSAKPSEQISVIIGPGPLAVDCDTTAVAATVAEPVTVVVKVDRGEGMTGPVRVQLVVPPHIRGVAADPVIVSPSESTVTLELRFTTDAGPWNMPLVVRATHGDGLARVVADAPLEIVENVP